MHQFIVDYSQPNYYVNEEETKSILLGKEINRINKTNEKYVGKEKLIEDFEKQNYSLDYQEYHLTYRAIGRSTNERTIISTILPKNCFICHSINHLVYFDHPMKGKNTIEDTIGQESQVYLMSVLNSLVRNYYIVIRFLQTLQ
jgi:hypothetical protein